MLLVLNADKSKEVRLTHPQSSFHSYNSAYIKY